MKYAKFRAKKDSKPNWIEAAIKSPGALHRQLNVPEDKSITKKKWKSQLRKAVS
jgi:hypothetical protein